MIVTIKGPAGFDEARKEPGRYEAKPVGSDYWEPFCDDEGNGWRNWNFAELTDPDTEWRRVPKEPTRRFTTSQVVALLEQDEGLVFEAPTTADLWSCNASADGVQTVFIIHFPNDYGGDSNGSPPLRDDWVLVHGTLPPEPQPSPPAEMTAEQAYEYLIDVDRFVVDRNWCVFRSKDRDTLDAQDEPYRPLAPVTKAEFERMRGNHA